MNEQKLRDKLISWLNNAYSMENEIIGLLQKHKEDAQGHPEIADKLQEHIELTQDHADAVKECIEILGGSTSETKSGSAKVMGNIMGMSSELMTDKIVFNSIIEYTTENFEIAIYQAIHQAAAQLDETEIATVCERILSEEIEMAQWLQENIPQVVGEIFNL